MLDDGKAIAIALKEYAHVDHGYAATVHKEQGMTVDRIHVLATPGLDCIMAQLRWCRSRPRHHVRMTEQSRVF